MFIFNRVSFTFFIFTVVLLSFQNCGEMQAIEGYNQQVSQSSEGSLSSGTFKEPDLATKILQRLATRTPQDDPTLIEMRELLASGQNLEAARLAVHTDNFLNVTIRDFAAKMSNREEQTDVPLNDFIASFIGVARDDKDARQLLSGDFFYWAPNASTKNELDSDILSSNLHFEDLDANFVNLAQELIESSEQYFKNSPTDSPMVLTDAAGVITSRAFMSSHAVGGTNRRLVEFSMSQFLCSPIESWADGAVSHGFVGRDITRKPIETFNSKCSSCHAPMDAMRPAFAHVDFTDGFMTYKKIFTQDPSDNGGSPVSVPANEQLIPSKFRRGKDTSPFGHAVVDDQWVNLVNDSMEWRTAKSGQGLKEFGIMLSESRQFSRCFAKRAFQTICYKDITDQQVVDDLADSFENSGYNLKELFANTIVHGACMGDYDDK